MSEFYVYVYKKPNGTPFYVGKGKDDRDSYHLKEALKESTIDCNKHKISTIRKIVAAGDSVVIERVCSNLPEDMAFELEGFLIEEIGRADLGKGPLCNMTNGGEGLSGLIRDISGENNPNYGRRGEAAIWFGRKHTQETKNKMANAQKGRVITEEHKAAMRKPKSEEGKAAIREAQRKLRESGYRPSEESNIKRSNTLKGRPSPMKGRQQSEEAKLKMSLQRKGVPKKKVTCPHCGKDVAVNTFNRWHGENCKEIAHECN